MSAKARSLLKKLRNKKMEEEGGQPSEKNEEKKVEETNTINLATIKLGERNSRSAPKDIKRQSESSIDPLDYFKTEHIIIKESTMEEYGDAGIKKDVEEEKKKEKEGENTKKIGNMMGVRGFKINFDEMMRVRAKVKKEPQQKSLSVGTRNAKAPQNKFEYVKKNTGNKEDSLFIKLTLAKNKFNRGNIPHLYEEILRRIDELKGIKDLPKNLSEELNEIIIDLKLDKNLVLCSDVQVVNDDEDSTDSIGKKISLDNIMNKMNIRGDM